MLQMPVNTDLQVGHFIESSPDGRNSLRELKFRFRRRRLFILHKHDRRKDSNLGSLSNSQKLAHQDSGLRKLV